MKFIPNGHGAQLVDFPHFPSLLAFLRSKNMFKIPDFRKFSTNLIQKLRLTNSNFHGKAVHTTLRSTMRMSYFLFPGSISDLFRFILTLFLLNIRLSGLLRHMV